MFQINMHRTVLQPQSFRLILAGRLFVDRPGFIILRACVAKSITINGHFNFHFDEALRRRGPLR